MEQDNSQINRFADEWGLTINGYNVEQIIAALASRITYLIKNEPEYFFQLMYRIDISEYKLSQALAGAESEFVIARMIWDRQLQKIILRKQTKAPDKTDADLEW